MKLEELRQLTEHLSPGAPPQTEKEMLQLMHSVGLEPGTFYQELEMSYRLVETHRDETRFNHTVNLHSHDFYELLYCTNTCDAEYLLGADRYRLQKGDVLVVPPGVSHRPLLPAQATEPYCRDVLWLSKEFFDQLVQHHPTYANLGRVQLLRTAGTHWEFLGDVFRAGVREAELQKPGWETLLMGNTIMLMVHLHRAMLDDHTVPLPVEAPQLLDRIMAYVEENLAEKITLADVARRFYVSQSTVSQTFHDRMNVSFYRCVTQRRLVEAKKLILQGLPLEQVGHRVGFTDHSTFYRAFKREFGISPRQFRKLQEENR